MRNVRAVDQEEEGVDYEVGQDFSVEPEAPMVGGIWSVGFVQCVDADGDDDSVLAKSSFATLARGGAGEAEPVPSGP